MKIITKDRVSLLDGDQAGTPRGFEVDGKLLSISLSELHSLVLLGDHMSCLSPYEIGKEFHSYVINRDVSKFPKEKKLRYLGRPLEDGENIDDISHVELFRGHLKQPFYYSVMEEGKLLCLFSFGELSNNRFSLFFEGAIDIA